MLLRPIDFYIVETSEDLIVKSTEILSQNEYLIKNPGLFFTILHKYLFTVIDDYDIIYYFLWYVY